MRVAILLLLLIIFFQGTLPSTTYRGCFFKTANAHSGSIKSKYPMIQGPADPLHTITIQEILRIQNCFAVYPIFYFYDDKDGNNAMATDEITVQNGPDGTVIFGKRLFNREYIKAYGGTTIPIVMAHEYAHIVDYKYGVLQNVGSKKTELFADFLAGFYMYHRVANGIITDVNQCAKSFESLGDTDFGSETHHGTSEERKDALMSGFERAREISLSKTFIPLTEIIDEGKIYIEDIEDAEEDVKIVKGLVAEGK